MNIFRFYEDKIADYIRMFYRKPFIFLKRRTYGSITHQTKETECLGF